jgi:hypothetical protein
MTATATKTPQLEGIAELADRFGVKPQLAHKWTMSKRFPAPAHELRSGRLWLATDVDKWVEEFRPDLAE